VPLTGFEPAIPASDRMKTDVFDEAATGIGTFYAAFQFVWNTQMQIDSTPYGFDVRWEFWFIFPILNLTNISLLQASR
jgi:hypothetical protein